MFYVVLVFLSSFINLASLNTAPGQPLPHADMLGAILLKQLSNTSYFDISVSDIILGNLDATNGTKDLNYEYKDDSLDIHVLDHDALKKAIDRIESRYGEQYDLRRKGSEAHGQNPYVKQKCMNMIRQSILYVKGRVNETWRYRQKFRKQQGYQIAVLYGAATAIVNKMESLYGQMRHLPWKTHFLWFLVIYEKLLACNTDITNLIERIYLIHEQFVIFRGPRQGSKKLSKKELLALEKMKSNSKQ